ncbi:MAG: F0F1 ATP synthase subunit epsilon [Nitrospirota bacterium]
MGFRLEITTPSSSAEWEVESLRAEDSSGSFGIMRRHLGFLTMLSPCILIFRQGGKELFAAVDGGILKVSSGGVTIASREAVEGDDFMKLKDLLKDKFYRKKEKDITFMDLLNNMEKLLVDSLIKFEKG